MNLPRRPSPRRPHLRSGLRGGAIFVFAVLALATMRGPAHPEPTDAGGSGEGEPAVVLRAVDTSREGVSEPWRRVLSDGLARAAALEGVLLCFSATPDPGCGGAQPVAAPEVRWSIAPSVTRHHGLVLVRVPLTLEVVPRTDEEGGPRGPGIGLFLVEDNRVVPADAEGADQDRDLAAHTATIIAQHADIRQWFAAARAGAPPAARLPAGWSGPDGQAAPSEGVKDEVPAAEEELQRQEDHILDLLIDGRFDASREAADRLMAREGIGEARRDRVERYRATAAARETVGSQPEAAESEVVESGVTEAVAAAPASPQAESDDRAAGAGAAGDSAIGDPPPRPFDYTFRVRVAPPGRGFIRGMDGRLRIYDGGVRFVPSGAGKDAGWSLGWSQIESWGEADGLWDVSHPLVLTPREGDSRYFVEVDRGGRFASGSGILRLLSRGSQRATVRRGD